MCRVIQNARTAARCRTPRTQSGLGKKLFLSLASVLIVLGVPEAVLRIGGYERRTPVFHMKFHVPEIESAGYDRDPILFWKLKRRFSGQVSENHPWHVTINSQRMRGADRPLEKPPGTFRIILIGDSTTFGWGVAEEQTYGRVLETLFQNSHPQANVEVLNAGVPGYSSYQGSKYLKRDLLKYRPDVVLVYFGLNDLTGARYHADKEQRFFENYQANPVASLAYRLRTYQLLCDVVSRYTTETRFDAYFAATRHFRVAPEDYRANLNAMKELGWTHGFQTFFITPVWYDQRGELFDYPFWLERQITMLAGVSPVIDTYSVVKREKSHAGELFLDTAHPTKQGHRLIAETIHQALLAHGAVR